MSITRVPEAVAASDSPAHSQVASAPVAAVQRGRRSRPVRVCMMVNHLEVGGLEKVVISLANGLGADFEVSVLCLNSEGPLRRELNLPDRQVAALGKRSGRSLPFLPVQLDLTALAGVRRFIRE